MSVVQEKAYDPKNSDGKSTLKFVVKCKRRSLLGAPLVD